MPRVTLCVDRQFAVLTENTAGLDRLTGFSHRHDPNLRDMYNSLVGDAHNFIFAELNRRLECNLKSSIASNVPLEFDHRPFNPRARCLCLMSAPLVECSRYISTIRH